MSDEHDRHDQYDRHESRNRQEAAPSLSERALALLLAEIHLELQGIRNTQGTMVRALSTIITQGEHQMAISQELRDAMAKVDTATTALGARFQALADRLTNDPTPDEVAAVAQDLSEDADRLNAIGANPANPVPSPIPPVTP